MYAIKESLVAKVRVFAYNELMNEHNKFHLFRSKYAFKFVVSSLFIYGKMNQMFVSCYKRNIA